ncbi:sll0102 [Synechocystis sp. PCC 6803]|uniref:RuBisCO accumulation factor 1 n=1 Tax=Synechocystis sp. (strain ATCC 27184 / PCC 6803 / Kazusa) TaxID=1111708 RepID=RAF1_SYNY3|nr:MULTISPECIES: RuBisCO accumulation factor 1 [unclassified Synechocystis]Q55875.1 RecName: Full=RuBisCO accumulation factor 1 [Synechocystis sp. PCC 6803 substr. Kazusa]BAM53768.1 hypothetical protein BEST7613_4837 [Synechocystis sp. PCC 6803] [Bacillus subtilis BEST7613]AGF52928.1 hypothetical protein MYO_126990 [Synechocystis sp. PCC 6803]ALJ68824.1 hypothetical protein AOY38_13865 [Synechocystis sp. PCC 6803]AVP90686.1 hypothetical protein C7I86_13985 [Synechocystis sp. IPPAS B-1465]MBD2
MTHSPESNPTVSAAEAAELIRSLLHKEGTWVDWGKKCQQLQKAGYGAEEIFEQSGFQKVQQNLVIVASQVYESLVKQGIDETVLSYYRGPKSDVLYELRILNHQQRAIAAVEAQQKNLAADEAKELAKAFQEFGYLSQLPEGFTDHPGDALAYQCWKLARQKKNLPERTRLIVKGLKFAHSPNARQAIEKLLTDLTAQPSRKAPLVPVFRLEEDQEAARLIPVAGTFPLQPQAVQAVQSLEQVEPFGLVSYQGEGAVVPVPQWQAILTAEDPVAIFCPAGQVSESLARKDEQVLVVVDRSKKIWNDGSYFLLNQGETVAIQWCETEPEREILAQVVLVLRPKKIFDANNLREPWQMDD